MIEEENTFSQHNSTIKTSSDQYSQQQSRNNIPQKLNVLRIPKTKPKGKRMSFIDPFCTASKSNPIRKSFMNYKSTPIQISAEKKRRHSRMSMGSVIRSNMSKDSSFCESKRSVDTNLVPHKDKYSSFKVYASTGYEDAQENEKANYLKVALHKRQRSKSITVPQPASL